MNKKLLEKIFEYIDARIAEASARNSQDGGLYESICSIDIKNELMELVDREY